MQYNNGTNGLYGLLMIRTIEQQQKNMLLPEGSLCFSSTFPLLYAILHYVAGVCYAD